MTDLFDYHGWMLRHTFIVWRSEHGDVQLPPTTLLVALDETGDEDLSDPVHPVFGVGGCAVLVGQYGDHLAGPWTRMKAEAFHGQSTRLHAAELRNPSAAQLSALARFFARPGYFRLAVLVTDRTKLAAPQVRFELVVAALLNRLGQIAQRVPFSKLAILCETNERTNARMWNMLRGLHVTRTFQGITSNVPIEVCHAPKQIGDPALEVADFVMHAAGGAVRTSRTGKPFLERKDFDAVFNRVPADWVEFVRIDEFGVKWSSA